MSTSLRLTRSVVGVHANNGKTALAADAQHNAVWQPTEPHQWAQCLSLLPVRYIVPNCAAPSDVRVIALTNPNATLLHTQDALVAHKSPGDAAVVFKTLDALHADSLLLVHVHGMGDMAAVPVSVGAHSSLSTARAPPDTFLAAGPDNRVVVGGRDAAVPVAVEKRVPVYPTQPANPKAVDHRYDTPAGKHSGTIALTSILIVVVAVAYSMRTVLV